MRDKPEAPPSDRPEPANDSGLRGNEKLYRDLIENSLGLICTHDENGKLLTVTKAAADALGYEISDLVVHNLREFTPAKFHRRVDTYIAHVFRYGTARGYLYLRTRTGEQATWVYRNKVYQ